MLALQLIHQHRYTPMQDSLDLLTGIQATRNQTQTQVLGTVAVHTKQHARQTAGKV